MAHKALIVVLDIEIQSDLIRGLCAFEAARHSYVSEVLYITPQTPYERQLAVSGARSQSQASQIKEEWAAVVDRTRNGYDYRDPRTGLIYPGSNPAHKAWLLHKDYIDKEYTARLELAESDVATHHECAGRVLKEHIQNKEVPTKLRTLGGTSSKFYSYFREYVWSSREWLDESQWLLLASSAVEKRQAKLASALVDPGLQGRRPIALAVRRAVWQRDCGVCVMCGTRERLEFDHIIPVVRGGSDTERNIQLLCESCNRSKGADLC